MLKSCKKVKVQTVLDLHYKKRNDQEIFHSSTKLIASDLDIDKTFSLNQFIKALWQKWKNILVKIGLSKM